jgi:hypothetical protein
VAVAVAGLHVVSGSGPSADAQAVPRSLILGGTYFENHTMQPVHVTGCVDAGTGTSDGLVVRIEAPRLGPPAAGQPAGTGTLYYQFGLDPDGSGANSIQANTGESASHPVADFDTEVRAFCETDAGTELFAYDPIPVHYNGRGDDPTVPPSSTTLPIESPVAPHAPAPSAVPIEGDPSFTG